MAPLEKDGELSDGYELQTTLFRAGDSTTHPTIAPPPTITLLNLHSLSAIGTHSTQLDTITVHSQALVARASLNTSALQPSIREGFLPLARSAAIID